MKNIRKHLVLIYAIGVSLFANAGSVNYGFEEGSSEGIIVENVPATVIDGALKIVIDENSQKWTAKLLIAVDEDIFDNPVMEIRYRVGTPVSSVANFPVTLKIDDQYTDNTYSGTWRLYPDVDLSGTEWQNLEIDLSPLIESWEAKNGSIHGNIQEITIFIGNNNGPFVTDELYIDYLRLGDMLRVGQVEVNPDNLREILVDVVVPITGSPNSSSFTVKREGTSLLIDTVFVRDQSTLVVELENPVEIPREVMDLHSLEITYNGEDDLKDTTNNVLEPFTEQVSVQAYAEDQWKYWGKYDFSDLPYPSHWFNNDTVLNGWDWSLPEFVEADSFAYFWYRVSPDFNFSCKNLNSVYVSWNELEPAQGQYNFELLRNRIINNARGYDGIVLRLLASVWNINSYPTPGGYVPDWLAARDNAPRWMDNLDIAKIPSHNAIDGKYLITNLDIMDPDYHNLYKKLIEELGKSGIPEMEELKIVNVCYRSASAGEEYTAYDASHNAIEGQYSSQIIKQRTTERLKAWAEAFGDNRHKLMWVGHDHKAYIEYAGELGIGSRQGFIEMYNSYVHMPQFGITINPETRYGEVDETNDFIKKDVAFGDENEEYTNELRFGWKESFPYRYYVSSFRMLQMRRNYVMHAGNTLNPELTWYVGMGLGRKVEDSPDAWSLLSEFYISPFANKNEDGTSNEGPVKNIERWLYQRDLPGYMTTPALKVPTAKDLWYADNTRPYDFTARKGKKIGFDIDDRLFPGGEQSLAVKISFYDGVAGSLKLSYENNQGTQTDSVITTGKDEVRTATFFISARIDDTGFDHNFDFIVESEEEVPVFIVRVIKTENSYHNTDQLPFGGTNRTIPGLIEGEHYDISTEGFGFHDDDTKDGDLSQRPGDNVDIVSKTNASNGYSIGYTNEGEWLEYTVDVTPGNYNIHLYYFCGTTPGDLIVSLEGEKIATISGLQNNGWEIQDTLTVEKVYLEGGRDKILRLEFINGAGFDIDAIEFIETIIPVTGVTIADCPTDTITIGNTHQFTASIEPVDPDDPAVSWSSSDTSVATVDERGILTALSEGEAAIIVTTNDGGFTDLCNIVVKKEIVPVIGVRINDCPGFILEAGENHKLAAIINPMDATNQSVTWSSSDTLVATVDEKGEIKALSEGTAIITVTTKDGGHKNSCSVGVISSEINTRHELTLGNQDIKIYPNPVSERLHIKFSGENKQRSLRLFNSYGQMIFNEYAIGLYKLVEIQELGVSGFILLQIVSGKDVSNFKVSVIR